MTAPIPPGKKNISLALLYFSSHFNVNTSKEKEKHWSKYSETLHHSTPHPDI
jgi:hypothetical protein